MRLAALLLLFCTQAAPARAEVTVFAASSLQTALDRVAQDWRADHEEGLVIAYGGSAALARQIEQGAPADVYISAAPEWMDVLQDQGLIVPGSRRDLAGNRLVLVGHGAGRAPDSIGPGLDLPGLLAGGKLSMGLLAAVPAGQYGQQALEHLGLWQAVQAQVVQSDSVRAALALVVLGEAPLGIVFASDALAAMAAGEPVTLLATFPPDSHQPILYPAALIARGAVGAGKTDVEQTEDRAQARAFLDYLFTDPAQAVLAAQGFVLIR